MIAEHEEPAVAACRSLVREVLVAVSASSEAEGVHYQLARGIDVENCGMSDTYLIIRVPKSGSTSLKSMVKDALPDHRFVGIPDLSRPDANLSRIERLRAFRKFTRRALKDHGVLTVEQLWDRLELLRKSGNLIISGHIPYAAIPNPGSFRLITMIRDPMARLVSEYKWKRHGFNKRGVLNRFYHRGRNYYASKSLEHYVDFLADHAELYANFTTNYVTGLSNHPDPVEFVKTHYWHYGLLEYSAAFASALSEKTGSPCMMPHVNSSPMREHVDVSDRVIEKFISFNEKDFELYQGLEKLIKERSSPV